MVPNSRNELGRPGTVKRLSESRKSAGPGSESFTNDQDDHTLNLPKYSHQHRMLNRKHMKNKLATLNISHDKSEEVYHPPKFEKKDLEWIIKSKYLIKCICYHSKKLQTSYKLSLNKKKEMCNAMI